MNKAREDHSSSAIGNSVWVFGGINGSGPLNSIERLKICRDNLTLTARKWETIDPHPDFSARANSAVCTVSRHKMLILGGNVPKGYLSDIWIMNAKRKTMKKIAHAPFAFHCLGQAYAMRDGLVYSLVNNREKGVCLVRFEVTSKSFDVIAEGMAGTFKSKQAQKMAMP